MVTTPSAPRGSAFMLTIAWLALAGGCARMPSTGVTSLRAANLGEVQNYLRSHKADVDLFRLRGPFAVNVHKDHDLLLPDGEHFSTDLYLSAPAEKAPLVILLHGQDNSKADHAYQAMHLATWGMHCLALQLPNEGPWVDNGKTVARIVAFIHRQPGAIDGRIDPGRIILVGHSYGGAAMAIALAEGAPAVGAVLLDPAGIGRELPDFLRRINKPVMLVGADEQVSRTRERGLFYRFIRVGIAEISIRDAAHEDGQYPLELESTSTSEPQQITFVSALTAAVLSLSATGKFDYAWTSFGGAIGNGKLFNAKKK